MRGSIATTTMFLLLLAGGARANGTIDTTSAAFSPGTAPTAGVVTIDPCVTGGNAPSIPPLGTLGSIGAMTGSLPAFPGGGSGGGAFHATSDQTLAGGSFDFATYVVDAGVTVTYSGAVTIRTTGDVSI